MLNAWHVASHDADPEGLARATDSLRQQGFTPAASLPWARGRLQAWSYPSQRESPDALVQNATGSACCVGPMWYRGAFGSAALTALLTDVEAHGEADETQLQGNFAAFVHTSGQCLLLNDLLGFVRIHASDDGRFHSTSWLATCAYAGPARLDADAAIEYVLLGASHSDHTPVEQVHTTPLATGVDLNHGRTVARRRLWLEPTVEAPASLDAACGQIGAHLRAHFHAVNRAFPGRTRTALSGGFDSRLIVAGLLAAGNQPELFVYGPEQSPDRRIASALAAAIDAPLQGVDKRQLNRDRPAPERDQLIANALFFDGLPTDGLWDHGADRETRLQQTADGHLALNGGGGEILRNYFHLPDRRLSALDVVRTFYRGFDPRVLRQPGALARYEERMATAIVEAITAPGTAPGHALERARIELAYPLFRCHHWMGLNNTLAVRSGHYTTPLVDPVSTQLTWRLPLAWKNVGRLESRLVTDLHPGLAAQPSAHGFRFSDGPSRGARLAAWQTRARPVAVRPLIGALGRRLRRQDADPALRTRFRQLLPGPWRIDPWLDLAALPDPAALIRAMSLEVVLRWVLDPHPGTPHAPEHR